MIEILNTCFWVSLVLAIAFFALTVVMFFVFDIKTIFNIKTGRAQAKTVKEMKAANDSTGRLRVGGKTQTSKLSEAQRKEPRAPAVKPPSDATKNLYYQPDGKEAGTDILQTDAGETEVLNSDAGETEVLSSNKTEAPETGETVVLSGHTGEIPIIKQQPEPEAISFSVIKKELYINSDEII